MGKGIGIKEVAWLDCAGGGQVVVDGNFAYLGHIDAPHGTTVVDVSDPKRPAIVAEIAVPHGIHSHKVRAKNGIMVVNREHHGRPEDGKRPGRGGLVIYDIANPRAPRQLRHWECDGSGVHRFTFDGRYAYISPEIEGYVGNIVMILDLQDPANPVEVGRWWMPGQWKAGGETATWRGRAHRHHHSIRRGDRLYTSYWHGGVVILDIADMAHPRLVSSIDWSPPFPWPTHSAVPIERTINGRRYMLVADEDVMPMDQEMAPEMSAFIWMVDITDETRPVPVGSYQCAGGRGPAQPGNDRLPPADRDHRGRRGAGGVVLQRAARPRHRQPARHGGCRHLCPRARHQRQARVQQRRLSRPARPDLSGRSLARIVDPRARVRRAMARALFALVVALVAAAGACRAEPVTIRIAWVAVPGHLYPVLIERKELLRHFGKSYIAEPIHFQGSAAELTALGAGELDIAALAYSTLGLAVQNAHMDDIRVIADAILDGHPGYYSARYVVLPDGPIKTIEDLKGKVLATNGIGGGVYMGMRLMLLKHGLAERRDYTVIEAQFPTMLAMLGEHKADLVTLEAFASHQAPEGKARTLFSLRDSMGETQLTLLAWRARRSSPPIARRWSISSRTCSAPRPGCSTPLTTPRRSTSWRASPSVRHRTSRAGCSKPATATAIPKSAPTSRPCNTMSTTSASSAS